MPNHDHSRIGEILVEQGVLSEQQVFEICETQRETGIPFGVLAEQMFDVTIQSIEGAWVEQYRRQTGLIDLDEESFDSSALSLLSRRQAWQFQMIPVNFESTGELLVAASSARLPRAVTFAAKHFQPVVYLRLVESEQLRAHLQQHYPMPEVSQDMLRRARELAYDG